MLDNKNIEFLSKTLTFWDKLGESEKDSILNSATRVIYNKGESIHRGIDDCIGVFIVKSGEVRTYMLSEDGREVTLYRLNEGEVCILSASCILKNITFDVNIDAEIDSEILLINSSVFSQLIKNNIYVENFSYKSAIDRFSDVMWAMEQLLFMSFDKRLASFILDELYKIGGDTINLTHEQIAKYMGSAREVVSRMLKYFAIEGIVKMSRGEIKVLDKNKLKKLI